MPPPLPFGRVCGRTLRGGVLHGIKRQLEVPRAKCDAVRTRGQMNAIPVQISEDRLYRFGMGSFTSMRIQQRYQALVRK